MASTGMTREETRIANEVLLEKLDSTDYGNVKEAQDAVLAYTKFKMREDGFLRRILPPETISNDQLTRSPKTDKPVFVADMEPDSPAAVSVPFATLPINYYITGPRYQVVFERIQTPRFTKDVDELRTWIMDIRQVLSDNSIKDMLAEEDGKFIATVDAVIRGVGLTCPTSNVVQHQAVGPMSRDSLWEMLKILPGTPSNLEVHTCLLNNITIKDVGKFGRTEMGGDLSQDIMKNGWTLQDFMGVRWIVTIKKTLVPTNRVYNFADPAFMGKHLTLEDVKMYIKREGPSIEFYSYESNGCTIANANSLAAADFV